MKGCMGKEDLLSKLLGGAKEEDEIEAPEIASLNDLLELLQETIAKKTMGVKQKPEAVAVEVKAEAAPESEEEEEKENPFA